MDIANLEAALVETLRQALPEFQVEPFPEEPEEYDFIHPLGAVLVQYDSADFQGDRALACTALPASLLFNVVVLTRNLRQHHGSYATLERVRRALLGLKLPGWEQVKQTRESFLAEEDGVWSFVQSYSVQTLVLQAYPNYQAQDPDYGEVLASFP